MFWSEEEVNILKNNYDLYDSYFELLNLFPGRTISSIQKKSIRLGLTKLNTLWSEEMKNLLREKYSYLNSDELKKLFPNQSIKSILL